MKGTRHTFVGMGKLAICVLLCLSFLLTACEQIFPSPGDGFSPGEEVAKWQEDLYGSLGLNTEQAQITSLTTPKVTSSTLTAKVDDTITISWDKVDNAQNYVVYLVGSEWQQIDTANTSINVKLTNSGTLGVYVYATGTFNGNWVQSDQSEGINVGVLQGANGSYSANTFTIPSEGGVYFANNGSYLNVYLPIARAKKYYEIISNKDLSSEFAKSELTPLLLDNVEMLLMYHGYELGPTFWYLYMAYELLDAYATYVVAPSKLWHYEKALNVVDENGFLVYTTVFEGYYAENSNKLGNTQSTNGYFVAMSQLSEGDCKEMSKFKGVLNIIMGSDIS